MKTKRSLCLILVAALVVTMFTACGNSESAAKQDTLTAAEAGTQASAAASEEQTPDNLSIEIVDGKRQLNVGWEYTTSALSPFVPVGGPYGSYYLQCLEALCAYDSQYSMYNVLAKDWSVDDTGTVCSVEIYDYITDSEGTNITAEDVCFSIEKCNEKGVVSNVKAAAPTGDYTLTIELEEYQIGSMDRILTSCPVVSKAKYEASGDEMATKLIATGPYVVAEHVPGSVTVLEANEKYWQTDNALKGPFAYANVDRIKYVTLSELSQREIALETGELNYIHSPGASSIEMLGGNKDFVYSEQPGPHTYLFLLSMRGVFSDIRVREALNYAIDRDGLIQGALNGYGYKIGVGLPAAHYNDAWTEGDHVAYDPEKAKELLEEAGVVGSKITLLGTANYSAIFELVQAYLNAVGLDTEIVTEEQIAWGKDWKDYEKYDITMARMQSNDCAYLFQTQASHDSAAHPGYTMAGIQDEKLEELADELSKPGGNNQENNNAIHDYLVQNYYVYCPMRSCILDMWRADSGIVKLAYGIAFRPAFGASTYVWNG